MLRAGAAAAGVTGGACSAPARWSGGSRTDGSCRMRSGQGAGLQEEDLGGGEAGAARMARAQSAAWSARRSCTSTKTSSSSRPPSRLATALQPV